MSVARVGPSRSQLEVRVDSRFDRIVSGEAASRAGRETVARLAEQFSGARAQALSRFRPWLISI
jgi:hypothetical protein